MTYDASMISRVAHGRTIIKLAITRKGHGALKALADEYGMKDYVAAGRIYEWFDQQDDIFQRAVLGLLKGLERDAAKEFMHRFGKTKDVGVKGSQGSKAVKKSGQAEEQAEAEKTPAV